MVPLPGKEPASFPRAFCFSHLTLSLGSGSQPWLSTRLLERPRARDYPVPDHNKQAPWKRWKTDHGISRRLEWSLCRVVGTPWLPLVGLLGRMEKQTVWMTHWPPASDVSRVPTSVCYFCSHWQHASPVFTLEPTCIWTLLTQALPLHAGHHPAQSPWTCSSDLPVAMPLF